MNLNELQIFINDPKLTPVRRGKAFSWERGNQGALLKAHLRGELRAGAANLSAEDTARWLCFDLDAHGGPLDVADCAFEAQALVAALERREILGCVERSGGGRGYHVWVFFEAPIAGADAHRLARALCPETLRIDGTRLRGEYFPKQPSRRGGQGSQVWLPGWGGAPAHCNVLDRVVTTSLVAVLGALAAIAPEPVIACAIATDDDLLPVVVRVRRFEQYLASAGAAISGNGGNNHTWALACVGVCDFLLEPDEAWAPFEAWNQDNDPPWEDRELQSFLRRAWTRERVGSKAHGEWFGTDEELQEWVEAQNISAIDYRIERIKRIKLLRSELGK